MEKRYYILVPPQHIRLAMKKAQGLLFAASGDESIYAYPIAIILGETEDKSLNRKAVPWTLTPQANSKILDGMTVLPFDNLKDIYALQRELGLPEKETGLFIAAKAHEPSPYSLPPFASLRIALLITEGVTFKIKYV